MNIKECYSQFDGDYEGVLSRLMKEERIVKYVVKFVDSNEIELMKSSLDAKDYETAFRCVHNLKGIALNLGFTRLRTSSEVLCEELRGYAPKNDMTEMIANVLTAYDEICDAIKKLDRQ